MTIRKVLSLILTIMIVFTSSAIAGCKGKLASFNFDEEYFLGMGEVLYETRFSCDKSVNKNFISTMTGVMGAKTQRVWMSCAGMCDRAEDSNEIIFRDDIVKAYQEYFNLLNDNGVERIIMMSQEYPLPYGTMAKAPFNNRVPHPEKDYELYVEWLHIIYDFYYKCAQLFPEVDYFEVGNEWDHLDVLSDLDYHFYDVEYVGVIAADVMWYVNKAVKAVDEANTVLFPSPMGGTLSQFQGARDMTEAVFEAIESKRCPTGEMFQGKYLYADVDYENYFQIMTMHPYPYYEPSKGSDMERWKSLVEQWKQDVLMTYQPLIDHNYPVKVWCTEFGVPNKKDGYWTDEHVKNGLPLYLDELKNFGFIETVVIFRICELYISDWNPRENIMGAFYSPDDPTNRAKPKETALTIYRYVHGENADTSPLYWYYNQYFQN